MGTGSVLDTDVRGGILRWVLAVLVTPRWYHDFKIKGSKIPFGHRASIVFDQEKIAHLTN